MYDVNFNEFEQSIDNINCIKAATDPADRAEVLEDGYSFTILNVVTFRYGGTTAVSVSSVLQSRRKSVGVSFNLPDAVPV